MGQYHEIWAAPAAPDQRFEHIDHYRFAAGAKLAEQCYTWTGDHWPPGHPEHRPSGYPSGLRTASPYAMAVGLSVLGRWAGRPLTVVGDYAEATDVPSWSHNVPLVELYGASETRWEPPSPHLDAVADISDDIERLLAEATGIRFEGERVWCDSVYPDDWDDRVVKLAALDDDDEYVLASDRGEYLDPKIFGSPRVRLAMPVIGAVWPVAIAMLACSDGRGGGDLDLEPAGRWANSVLGCIPLSAARDRDLLDVSEWALSSGLVIRWVMGDE